MTSFVCLIPCDGLTLSDVLLRTILKMFSGLRHHLRKVGLKQLSLAGKNVYEAVLPGHLGIGKDYHREDGSDYCLQLYSNRVHIIISELARVEFHSAVYRKHREKQFNFKALNAVLKRFKQDCQERFEVLQVALMVYGEACSLLSLAMPPWPQDT